MPLSNDVAPLIRFSSSTTPAPSQLHLRRLSIPALPPFSLMTSASSLLRTLFPAIRAACAWFSGPTLALALPPSTLRRRVTVTFFGHRNGHVSFAVQETPRSDLLLLLQLATPTCHLVKEMASGMVRILLESEHDNPAAGTNNKKKTKRALWEEPRWSMYCNGHRCGYAVARECTPEDARLLSAVSAVSVGAGVMSMSPPATALPSPAGGKDDSFDRCGSRVGGDGELMYMRAKFERVVGNKDSEALYMMNPDAGGKGAGSGNNTGPELSIFLLRV